MEIRNSGKPDAICSDPARLDALARYDILDTPREREYDDIVRIAAQICGTPISVINFILDDRQWFKAEVGLGIRETPLDVSICRHMLLQPGVTVIHDMREDRRLADNPLVKSEPHLQFYAGALLSTLDGHPLGTLCVLDHRHRDLDEGQRFALQALARQVMSQMELRRSLREQTALVEQKAILLKELNHRVKNSLQMIASLVSIQSKHADPAIRTVLEETRSRVMTVASLHERLYQAQEVQRVELGDYARSIVGAIAASALGMARRIQIEVRGDAVWLPTDRTVPLGLIINELLTNALKYAYPEGDGRIEVGIAAGEKGAHRITVADDGVGLPDGFDLLSGQSLGMRIVMALARQIDADVSWNSPGRGTVFAVALRPGE